MPKSVPRLLQNCLLRLAIAALRAAPYPGRLRTRSVSFEPAWQVDRLASFLPLARSQ
jgi:hypothetical protein